MFNNILSITEYNQTHNIIKFLGFKIKLPKPKYANIYKNLPYQKYKKNNLPISSIPKAEGVFRDIQLANLTLLKEFDYVCKKNDLTYWLDFGTLLGAIRHKGFIPWDDDIDIGMLRSDYNKLIDCFKKSSKDSDIFADFVKCENNNSQIILKIMHKKCKELFVDVFPYDIYDKALTTEAQINKTLELKQLRKDLQKEFQQDFSIADTINLINIFKNKIKLIDNLNDKNDLVWGIDYNHSWKNWFSPFSTIFPLKTIEFEGYEFPCFNKPEEYLTKVYGDYMAYPKKFGYGHNMFVDFDNKTKDLISEIIKNKEQL